MRVAWGQQPGVGRGVRRGLEAGGFIRRRAGAAWIAPRIRCLVLAASWLLENHNGRNLCRNCSASRGTWVSAGALLRARPWPGSGNRSCDRQAGGQLPHMVRISADRSKQADQKIPWPGMRSREAPCERLACESSLISLRVKLSKAFSDISDNVLSQYVTFIPLWRERSRSPVPVFPSRLT